MIRGNKLHISRTARKLVPAVLPIDQALPRDRRGKIGTAGRYLVPALLAASLVTSAAAVPAQTYGPASPAKNGNLVAFFSLPQDPPSGSASGRLVSFAAPDRKGYAEIVLSDANGVEHCIAWRGAPRSPYLVRNGHYSVTVEHHVSPVTASSIVIRDEQGLVYAGVTDRSPGDNVLRCGLAGFSIRVDAADGASGGPSLYVNHDGQGVALRAGETGRIGIYEILCISVPTLRSDAPGTLSWIITRNRAGADDEENMAALHGRHTLYGLQNAMFAAGLSPARPKAPPTASSSP